ncbi:odorant receptor Or1-like isoform X1 [Hylaeus volcanicus]|uniref:odorant receptor Or1-like isoform X1 n=2 Tax=Hylaeus volcanicus TaxID=313075 RepID=UPI0023B87430|nr:odorant receptor Or1-like isoform X1 [Hylaeus volcanicus]XP_053989650.1 odorant receptor Or1-like isoform X1 [Hylaeus volcanicus]
MFSVEEFINKLPIDKVLIAKPKYKYPSKFNTNVMLGRLNGITLATAVLSLLIAMFGTALIDDNPRKLAYRIWLPYNYSSPVVYTVTFVWEAVGMIMAAFINVGSDSLFSGLLIHIYCLFEIFEHRLKKGVNEPGTYSLKECVRLHKHIYKFAEMVNEEFKTIMMMQFLVSTLALCSELYRLTQRKVDSQYIEIVTYATCVVMQLLFFCWYGNEVRLKSLEISDMIYESNWMSLDPDAKKILLTIMIRSTSPIEFSSAQIFSMNLNSFMTIMKMAYSAYNMLHR